MEISIIIIIKDALFSFASLIIVDVLTVYFLILDNLKNRKKPEKSEIKITD